MSDRKKIDWPLVRGAPAWTAIIVGTFFGSGLLPKAPGTWGTLAAVPLALAVAPYPMEWKLGFWAILFFTGVWAGKKFQDLFGIADNQHIVMDEVVGFGITVLILPQDADWRLWVIAFFLFRFFDIVKLPPVGSLDRWSKTVAGRGTRPHEAWTGGFGVMIDDLVAGVQGLVLLALAHRYFHWW